MNASNGSTENLTPESDAKETLRALAESTPVPTEAAGAVEPPTRWLRRFWERMASMYGAPWHNTQGVSPQDESGHLTAAGETWSAALSGLTGEQIATGLRACLADGREFAPSAPRFRAMCFNLPTESEVKADIGRERSKRAPFTILVLRHLNLWDWRHADARQADRLLSNAYEQAKASVIRGDPLPQPLPEIASEVSVSRPAPPEVAEKHLAEIGEFLRSATNQQG